ncbi:MAG: hypothetical protein AB8H47_27865 [Bacteroidia bacterium]
MKSESPQKSTRKQSYYHQDEGFDFEKFFQCIYSFVVPIIEGEQLLITTTFVYENEQGAPYASYRIPKHYTREFPDFADEARFLERFPIDLLGGNKSSAQKIFQQFESLSLLESKVLKAQVLKEYFEEVGLTTPDPNEIDFDKEEDTIDNLLTAEKIYLKVALQEKGISLDETPLYWPLPIISQGSLIGVMYIIASPRAFRGKGKDKVEDGTKISGIQQYHRLLILMATREYENVRLESKFKSYDVKPQEPLEDYLAVFQDLNETNDLSKQKNIQYNPMYGYPNLGITPITGNPFLSELGYDDYYEKIAPVIIRESEQLLRGRSDKIKTAITAIIVDSFAHNIGTHSLVALKWWFENRYKIAAKSFPVSGRLSSEIDPINIDQKIKDSITTTKEFHAFMDAVDRLTDESDPELSLLNIVRFMDEESQNNLLTFHDPDGNQLASFPVPVAQSIYQFFQYLRDKSAFWSGVARDTVFSGEIKSWSDLIRQYINNTLFLGTIAHSEGINKLAIHLEIMEPESEGEKDSIKVGGEYAVINLEVMEREKAKALELDYDKPNADPLGYSEYTFLRMGKDFKNIQAVLETLDDVFLPNGVIGQHALYTIWENTLRNVKHYKSQLKEMKDGGLKLFISIQSVYLRKKRTERFTAYSLSEEQSLFKVGTWLHHPQILTHLEGAKINEEKESFHGKGGVIESHTQQLRRRVIDRDGNPILGGSSQDKVCAAMLINNLFLSIDGVNQKMVKRHYYPYVFAASEFYTNPSARRNGFIIEDAILHKIYNSQLVEKEGSKPKAEYKAEVKKYIQNVEERIAENSDDPFHSHGTIKKFFHLWKGRKVQVVDEKFDPQNDNISRFKVVAVEQFRITNGGNAEEIPFVNTYEGDEKVSALHELRNKGILRLVEAKADWTSHDPQTQYELAMQRWLGDWLGNEQERQDYLLCKPAGSKFKAVSAISLLNTEDGWKLVYYNESSLDNEPEFRSQIRKDTLKQIPRLNIAHAKAYANAEDCCMLRSHTSFFHDIFRYTLDGEEVEHDFKSFVKADFPNLDKPMKLIETGLTHISFFDARIYERLPLYQEADKLNKRYQVFSSQLRLAAFPEEGGVFNSQRENLLKKRSHFIVMHLSFLETLKKANGERYRESEVEAFFEEEIKKWYEAKFQKPLPTNIILVIVSGRGRGDWFEATRHPQITFRPIEVILDAIEDGLSLKDDFQVKFNLCNVLFGS